MGSGPGEPKILTGGASCGILGTGMSAVPDLDTLLAHAGWLERLSLQLCRDEHTAADAVQDTWQAALRTAHRSRESAGHVMWRGFGTAGRIDHPAGAIISPSWRSPSVRASRSPSHHGQEHLEARWSRNGMRYARRQADDPPLLHAVHLLAHREGALALEHEGEGLMGNGVAADRLP